jgi:hypothetical protein
MAVAGLPPTLTPTNLTNPSIFHKRLYTNPELPDATGL